MKVNKSELSVWVDVDDTLILYDVEGGAKIDLNYYGIWKTVTIHQDHVDLVKAYNARGYKVTVHSNNGWKWALEVVKALRLEPYVYEVRGKPTKIMDDQDIGNAFGAKVYIPFHPR